MRVTYPNSVRERKAVKISESDGRWRGLEEGQDRSRRKKGKSRVEAG